jgi:hypothetical protein
VTNAGPHGFHTDEERVGVAIEEELANAKDVAASFAFFPEALAGAAVEVDFAGALGVFERFGIQEAEHQHFARGVVLNDRGDQPVQLCKGKFHQSLPKTKNPPGRLAPAG